MLSRKRVREVCVTPPLNGQIVMSAIFDATYRKIYHYAIEIGDSHFVEYAV
jgi:hypothetical protein